MRGDSRSDLGLRSAWREWSQEQRAAAGGAVLLMLSTLGPFSFVEAAIVVVAAGVLLLLKNRAERRTFDLPWADGTVIAAAGGWSAMLVLVRLFDRPLGQGILALACAALLMLAGWRDRMAAGSAEPPSETPLPP